MPSAFFRDFPPVRSAWFKCDGWTDERAVHAFEDDGIALILHRGRLYPARDVPGFTATVERGAPVGVLPGDGWTARYEYHNVVYDTPVVGFVLDHDGIGGVLLAVGGDDGPIIVRDDWPGLELLELHAPAAPKVTGRLMAPSNGHWRHAENPTASARHARLLPRRLSTTQMPWRQGGATEQYRQRLRGRRGGLPGSGSV